jgi:diguanylate cyclase (GGDEF)-like protein
MRVRQLLARTKGTTFAIDSVATLYAGVERLAAVPFDLILLDLDLPDSLGLDTLTSLAAASPSTPIVVLCRPTDEALGLESVQAGAQDYVLKQSVSAEGLARVVRCAVERHRVVNSLRGLSLTDELTGLFNRRGFTTLAQGHLRLAGRTGQQFVLLFVDVDGLKRINDERGHHAGDLVLARVAEVLRTTFRQSDLVARYGGDEFAILAVDLSGDGGVVLRRRLSSNLDRANEIHPELPQLSLSVGILSLDGRLEEPLGALLGRADQILYADKKVRREAAPEVGSVAGRRLDPLEHGSD